MKTKSKQKLIFGHSLTHSKRYQKSVGVKNAKCEHDRLVGIMQKHNINHQSPFKAKR